MKKRINITIDEKSLNMLDDMAKDRGIDRSTMVTLLVRIKEMEQRKAYEHYLCNNAHTLFFVPSL